MILSQALGRGRIYQQLPPKTSELTDKTILIIQGHILDINNGK